MIQNINQDNKSPKSNNLLGLIYRYTIRLFKDPVFGLAVAVSALLWFFNSLSEDYTAVVSVPVEIMGVIDSKSDDKIADPKKNNVFEVDCRVSGRGYNIILVSLFGGVQINAVDLPIVKENDEYSIDTKQMEEKMGEQMTRVSLISVYKKKLSFKTVAHGTKIVPVKANVTFRNDSEYMPIGAIQLEPKTVKISGSIEKLDLITEVHTDNISLSARKDFVSGQAVVKPIADVDISVNQIYYSMNFQRYTEVKIRKRVEIRNETRGISYSVVPSHVYVIFNVAENVYADFDESKYSVFIDMKDKTQKGLSTSYLGDNKFVVQYTSTPKGVRVQAVDPVFVTALRGNVGDKR